MKMYLDKEKIKLAQMSAGKQEPMSKLCLNAGINHGQLCESIKHKRATPTLAWLIADCLGCPMQELYEVDWSRER